MYNVEGLRAVSLLRVSTEKQTSKDDKDIPTQREIVNEFIKKEGLLCVREFIEGGVSGYKTAYADRDAINDIKIMAERKEFDVLVVYLPDRIGRSSFETPMIINFFVKKNIRILSTIQEIKMDTQMDKISTFLTFWQSESESVKISQRSTDYQIKAIENGQFRGGGYKACPYGYKIVKYKRLNSKGKEISDLVVDEEQAEMVKLIFNLSIENNMGSRAIAKYLNSNENYRTKSKYKDGWRYTTIDRMFNNVTYKGYLHMYSKLYNKEVISPLREDLAIIHEDIWERNQEIINNRKRKLKNSEEQKTNATNSRVQLSGLVYCGHCNSKMYAWTNHKKLKNETKKIDYYKCKYESLDNSQICENKRTHVAHKIESIVKEETLEMIKKLSQQNLPSDMSDNVKKDIFNLEKINKEKEVIRNKKVLQIVRLKKEIPNALMGDGDWSVEDLKESMKLIEEDLKKLDDNIEENNKKIKKLKSILEDYSNINENMIDWEERFNNADTLGKRALYRQLIDKIIIFRDEIIINFKISKKTYEEGCVIGSERILRK